MAAGGSPGERPGRPPSPPSDNDMPGGLQHFFQPSTASPQLPVSPPDSPVNRKSSSSRTSNYQKQDKTPEQRQKTGSSSRQQHRQMSEDRSPSQHKTKLAFPTIILDNDDDWSPLVGGAPDDPSSWSARGVGAKSRSSRTWSQTTTTTTHKTEHRSYRYSMPGFDELQDDFEPLSASRRSSHAQPHLGASPSTSSSRGSYEPESRSSPSRHSFSSSKHSRPRSSSLASAPRRRPSTPASTRSPRSSQTSRKASHLHQSFSGPSSQHSRALSPRPSSRSNHPLDPSPFDNYSLTTTTHDFFEPIMSFLAFLVISTVAVASISAVLVTSFSLTLYDDCGRRVGDFQRRIGAGRRRVRGSIEGVKVGMEKVVGGARGALDLAVWAAAARMPQVRAAPTIILSDPEDDSEEEWESSASVTRPPTPKPHRTRPFQRRRRSTIGSTTGSRRPTSERDASAPPPPVFDPANSPAERERQPSNTWTDEEDATPYDVPHTTPWGSRPASPPPLQHRPSPSSPRPDAMPPRPPLRILIPSILFALLYTLVKVGWAWWNEQKAARMRTSARGRGSARGPRR